MDGSTNVQIQILLDRFLVGDPAARSELVRVAEDRLLTLTRRMLRDFPRGREHDDTEGILNESYLQFHAALDQVKPTTPRDFLGLAALAIRRTLLDLVKKFRGRGKRARTRPVSLDGGRVVPPTPPIKPHPLDLIESVFAAIDELPGDLQEVVMLHHFQGFTQREIADLLGVHEVTIKRRWASARVLLADKLAAFAPDGES